MSGTHRFGSAPWRLTAVDDWPVPCRRPTAAAREISRKGGTEPHVACSSHSSRPFRNDDEGQGLAEYALILALIAIVAIVALIFLGGQVSTILSTVGNSV